MHSDTDSATSVHDPFPIAHSDSFNATVTALLCEVVEEQTEYQNSVTGSGDILKDHNCDENNSGNGKLDFPNICGPSYNILSRWRRRLVDTCQISVLNLEMTAQLTFSDQRKALNFRLVCSLRQLQSLSLSKNGLQNHHVTNHIGCLTQLTVLDLSGNMLTTLPYGIQFCKALTYLCITDNYFTHMPFVLTKLPNIRTISRCQNSFNDSYHYLRTSLQTRLQQHRLTPETDAPSLLTLAKRTSLSSGVIFAVPRSQIPDYLLELVCAIPALRQCDQCSQAIVECEHRFLVFPTNFHGLCMPPVQAMTCSVECAQALMSIWDAPYDQTPPAGQLVDITGARHAGSRHRRRPRLVSSIRRCNVM